VARLWGFDVHLESVDVNGVVGDRRTVSSRRT